MAAVDQVPSTAPEAASSPLAIVCGSGQLPFAVADAVRRRGREVFLLAFTGWADPATVAGYPHRWIAVGQFGTGWRLAREAGCRDIVCIGGVLRPALRTLRLDWKTITLLPTLYRLWRGGDDHLLAGLGKLFEEHGFRLVGAHEVAPEILVPEGLLSRREPSAGHLADAARGFALLDSMGPFDVGQAAVIADNRVLAIEAAEGTDAMLGRVAELHRSGRIRLVEGTGVLVKASKPGQERRLDLPAIGPTTVEGVRQAGLAGIALRADEVIAADPEVLVATADKAGLFILGVAASPMPHR